MTGASSAPPWTVRLDPLPGLERALSLATHAPQRDLVSRKIQEERVWEPFESRLWIACQRGGDVVVDVGANLGYFAILSALHLAPASKIFAFEPARENYRLLCANLALNDCQHQVEALNAALGDASGAGALHCSEDNFGDHQIYAGDGLRSVESITVLQGSRFLSPQIECISLLKVDTQGSEYAVIDGLLPLLRRSLPDLRMLIELTPYSLRLAGSSGRALVTLIAELELPFAIVDHLAGRLVPCSSEALCEWADNVDAVRGDRGFMNIFVGTSPQGIPIQGD